MKVFGILLFCGAVITASLVIISIVLWAPDSPKTVYDISLVEPTDPLMGEHCLDAQRYNYAHRFWFDSLYVAKDWGDGCYQTYFFNNGEAILPWFITPAESLKAWGG